MGQIRDATDRLATVYYKLSRHACIYRFDVIIIRFRCRQSRIVEKIRYIVDVLLVVVASAVCVLESCCEIVFEWIINLFLNDCCFSDFVCLKFEKKMIRTISKKSRIDIWQLLRYSDDVSIRFYCLLSFRVYHEVFRIFFPTYLQTVIQFNDV